MDPKIERCESEKQFIKYSYRWIILVTICLVFTINGFLFTYQLPFTTIMATAYNLEVQTVNLMNMMEPIFFFPGTYVLGALLNRYSTKWVTILLASSLLSLCAGARALINVSFAFCFIANALKGLGSPLIYNFISKTTAAWFPDDERSLATIIAMTCFNVGMVLSFIMSTRLVEPSDPIDSVRSQLIYSNLWAFIFSTALVLISVILFRNDPPTPPSISATIQSKEENLIDDLKLIIKQGYLILFIIAQAVFSGILYSNGPGLSIYFVIFGYSSTDIGNVCLTINIFGIVSCIVFSFVIRKTRKFKLILSILSIIITILFGILMLALMNLCSLYIVYDIIGAAFQPFLAISQEYVCELGFPISPGSVTGILNSLSMLLYLIGVIVEGAILNSAQKSNAYAYISGMTFLHIFVSISVIIVPERLREKEALKVGEAKQLPSEDSAIIHNLNGSPQVTPKIKDSSSNIPVGQKPDNIFQIQEDKSPPKEV